MARVQLVMPDADRDRFVDQARREGMSLSAWLRAGRETSRTAELFEVPDDKSGTVLLRDQGSFYGALGLTFRNQVLGDFVFDTWLVGFLEGDRFQAACAPARRDNGGWWTWATRAPSPWKTSRSCPSATHETTLNSGGQRVLGEG